MRALEMGVQFHSYAVGPGIDVFGFQGISTAIDGYKAGISVMAAAC